MPAYRKKCAITMFCNYISYRSILAVMLFLTHNSGAENKFKLPEPAVTKVMLQDGELSLSDIKDYITQTIDECEAKEEAGENELPWDEWYGMLDELPSNDETKSLRDFMGASQMLSFDGIYEEFLSNITLSKLQDLADQIDFLGSSINSAYSGSEVTASETQHDLTTGIDNEKELLGPAFLTVGNLLQTLVDRVLTFFVNEEVPGLIRIFMFALLLPPMLPLFATYTCDSIGGSWLTSLIIVPICSALFGSIGQPLYPAVVGLYVLFVLCQWTGNCSVNLKASFFAQCEYKKFLREVIPLLISSVELDA